VETGSHIDDIDGLEIEFETTWPLPVSSENGAD
jgi:hypothetical protein